MVTSNEKKSWNVFDGVCMSYKSGWCSVIVIVVVVSVGSMASASTLGSLVYGVNGVE